jgi:hypothetical protein
MIVRKSEMEIDKMKKKRKKINNKFFLLSRLNDFTRTFIMDEDDDNHDNGNERSILLQVCLLQTYLSSNNNFE